MIPYHDYEGAEYEYPPHEEIELKPCPFCGGEAYFLTPKTMNSSFVSVGVECKMCGANPYSVLVYKFDTDENKKNAVAELWNRRTN